MSDDAELICHRCSALLPRGAGAFYIVRIEAFADPTPPEITADDLLTSDAETTADYEALLAQMSDRSERELLDDIHRRLTILLCAKCYRAWIENPAG